MLPLPPPPPSPYRVDGKDNPANNIAVMLDRLGWKLIYHRSEFLIHTGTHYQRIAPDFLESRVSWYFENAEWWWPGTQQQAGEYRKFPVTNSTLNDLMRALRNKVVVTDDVNLNSWLTNKPGDPSPTDLIPMRNGLLNTATMELLPHTARFLSTYVLSFDYDPAAPDPVEFFSYLRSCFASDVDRVNLTQSMLAYLLTPRMDLHKMFVLTGPPRSGKGTLARVIEQLVGGENYGATSLAMLGNDFGLENIANKPVVVLGDAAFTGRGTAGLALERLLGIVGQDSMVINVKMKRPYTAKLPCRFLLIANDLPELPDKAQALRSRWMHLRFTVSHAGHEDRQLDHKLAAELPGIFNWALKGLDRLRLAGEFVQPEVGKSDMDLLTQIVAPLTTFVRETCDVGPVTDPSFREANAELYLAVTNWAIEAGVDKKEIGSNVAFAKRLRAVPSCGHLEGGKTLAATDPTGVQRNATLGIRLTPQARARYVMDTDSFKLSRVTSMPVQWAQNL